ncbi:hypothetical protein Q3G72_011872 [Acer saccharum]|nr:hypothetical protein Q3G72_011872 [Acer saccharum]
MTCDPRTRHELEVLSSCVFFTSPSCSSSSSLSSSSLRLLVVLKNEERGSLEDVIAVSAWRNEERHRFRELMNVVDYL